MPLFLFLGERMGLQWLHVQQSFDVLWWWQVALPCCKSCLVPVHVSTFWLNKGEQHLAAVWEVKENNSRCTFAPTMFFEQNKENQSPKQFCLKLTAPNRKYFHFEASDDLWEAADSNTVYTARSPICKISATLQHWLSLNLPNKTCLLLMPMRFMYIFKFCFPCRDIAN